MSYAESITSANNPTFPKLLVVPNLATVGYLKIEFET